MSKKKPATRKGTSPINLLEDPSYRDLTIVTGELVVQTHDVAFHLAPSFDKVEGLVEDLIDVADTSRDDMERSRAAIAAVRLLAAYEAYVSFEAPTVIEK